MAEEQELLRQILVEQKLTSLFTVTLERDRLYSALYQAGLITNLALSTEFLLAPGATASIFNLVPRGFVYLNAGEALWKTSLPWWCTYRVWIDSQPPAIPVAAVIRMPDQVSTDFKGIFPIRGWILHTVTNNHAFLDAYVGIKAMYVIAEEKTWDMMKKVYIDPIIEYVRKYAEEKSGRI